MSNLKKTAVAAICVALCLVLPWAFHAFPPLASIISPMHIPVLLCGLIAGPVYGTLCGIIGPLLSSVITQMPSMAYLPPMMVECAVYGFLAGLMIRCVRTKHLYADLYLSLLVAMIGGRLLAGAAKALIFAAGAYSFKMWAMSYFVTSLPGIAIQLALIPSVIVALEAAHLIPGRYPKGKQ